MINITQLSLQLHTIFNISTVFLYFLLLFELSKEKPNVKLIKVQGLYCALFVIISFLFGGFYYGTIVKTSLYQANFYVQAKANLFFIIPFLSFVVFYLAYALDKKIHDDSRIRKAYSLYVFVVFALISVISFLEILKY